MNQSLIIKKNSVNYPDPPPYLLDTSYNQHGELPSEVSRSLNLQSLSISNSRQAGTNKMSIWDAL
jgi:hypothetical protein